MKTAYKSARISLSIVDTITWCMIIPALLIAIKTYLDGNIILAIGITAGAAIFGIFEFAATQFARALIDTADEARKIRVLLENTQNTKPAPVKPHKNGSSRSGRIEPVIRQTP